jgi:hypothetical protein
MSSTSIDLSILDKPFALKQAQIDFYQQHRFIKIKQVLPPEVIEYYGNLIANKVKELNTMHLPMDQRDTYDKAFLQIMNLWTKDEDIKRFVFSRRLASIAAQLMNVEGVRLYHDQALFKEPGGGITPWHVDQYYWPLSNDHTATIWIPMQETPMEMGPLEFSDQSHTLKLGRDLAISDESEQKIEEALEKEGFKTVATPYELGEVSFHSGWLFHRAGANRSDQMRRVMTVIYMDKNMRLKAPENDHQQADWDTWCPGAEIREVIDTPLNPVLI